MSNQRQLLIETLEFEPSAFHIEEDAKTGRMVMRGPFQKADVENANGRIYPKRLWEKVLTSDKVKNRIEERAMFAELDHPGDGRTQLKRVSHIITGLRLNPDGIIEGEAEILDTPNGKILRELVESGCKVAISSRGMGSVSRKTKEVQDDYNLETFDMVASPSTPGAYPKPVGSLRSESNETATRSMTFEEAVKTIKAAKTSLLNGPVTLGHDNGKKIEAINSLLEHELQLESVRSASLASETHQLASEVQGQVRSTRLSLEESLQGIIQERVEITGGTETMTMNATATKDDAARLGILEHEHERLEAGINQLVEENDSLSQLYDASLGIIDELKDRYKDLAAHAQSIGGRLEASEGIINEFLSQTNESEEAQPGSGQSETLTEEKFLAREASSVTLIETLMRRLRKSEDIIEQLVHRAVAGENLGNAFLRKMKRDALAVAVEEAVSVLPGEEAQNKARALLEGAGSVTEVQNRVMALAEVAEATVNASRRSGAPPRVPREPLPTQEARSNVASGKSQQLMESVDRQQQQQGSNGPQTNPAVRRARDLKNMLGGK